MMEGLSLLQRLSGVDGTTLAAVSGVVLLVVQAIKRWVPGFAGGWRTRAVAFVISALIAMRLVYPDWMTVVSLAVVAWLLALGGKELINKLEPSNRPSRRTQ